MVWSFSCIYYLLLSFPLLPWTLSCCSLLRVGVVSEVGHNYVLIIHYWALESKTLACVRQDPIEQFLGKEDSKLHVLNFSSRLVRLIYGAPLDVCFINSFIVCI